MPVAALPGTDPVRKMAQGAHEISPEGKIRPMGEQIVIVGVGRRTIKIKLKS